MSEVLQVRGFATQGLNTDIVPWDLDVGYLTDMNNMRVINKKLVSFGGYRNWSTPPVEFNPGFLINAGVRTGDFYVVAGATAVYSFDGINWEDISIAPYPDYTKHNWTGCVFSDFIVLTHPQGFPEYWSGILATTPLETLPWSTGVTWEDVDKRASIIRSHKDFLIALDLNESGIDLIDSVRWSTAADVGFLPATWDETDPEALAGIAQLGGGGGKIIDGLSMRDAFVIYRENGISVMDYTGDIFVWRIRHLEQSNHLLNKDCIVEVKGVHFFIGDGDILRNNGNTIESIMHHRIRVKFNNSLNGEALDTAYAVKNELTKEIWFCVAEEEHEYPNKAYIYNWRDDTWFIRDLLPDHVFMYYGPELASVRREWDTWPETWNTATEFWNSGGRTPLDTAMVAIKKDPYPESSLILVDNRDNDNPEYYNSFVERTDFPLEGQVNVTTIQTVFPHLQGTVDIKVTVGSQDHAGSAIRWKAPIIFNPSTDRRVPMRTTGELHCFRYEIVDAQGGDWAISGMDVKYTLSGER